MLNTTEIQVIPNYLQDQARGVVEAQGYNKQKEICVQELGKEKAVNVSISCRLLYAKVHLTNIINRE